MKSEYQLEFNTSALNEWKKLDGSIRVQFKKILQRRLIEPHIRAALLHGMPNCYKIKLRKVGYRLVYQVDDLTITVIVVAVGKREASAVYIAAKQRLM